MGAELGDPLGAELGKALGATVRPTINNVLHQHQLSVSYNNFIKGSIELETTKVPYHSNNNDNDDFMASMNETVTDWANEGFYIAFEYAYKQGDNDDDHEWPRRPARWRHCVPQWLPVRHRR